MTLVLLGELFAAYTFVGALVVLFAFATWDWLRDAKARRRIAVLIAREESYVREERVALELDYLFSLPSVEHP